MLQRGWIDHVALDPFILQHTMNPKAVQPRFLNDDDRKGATRSSPSLLLKLSEALQQSGDIAAAHRMLRHFLAAARRQRCDQPS